MLRTILEERRSDLHRGGKLKSLTFTLVGRGNNTQMNKSQWFLIRSVPVQWIVIYIYIYIYIQGVPGGMCQTLGVFLMLKYTDITQNTYIQSWTVTEIMAWEKWGLLAVPNTATCTAVSRESVDDLECSVNRACVTFSCLHGSWKRHVKCLEP